MAVAVVSDDNNSTNKRSLSLHQPVVVQPVQYISVGATGRAVSRYATDLSETIECSLYSVFQNDTIFKSTP